MDGIWSTAAAVLISLSGGGAIAYWFADKIAKVWADRALEKLRVDLQIASTKDLQRHSDKVLIYRACIDLVAEVVGDFDRCILEGRPVGSIDRVDAFNRQRIRLYAYLGMYSSQQVMERFDALTMYLGASAFGKQPYAWEHMRKLALELLNAMRADVGTEGRIEYREPVFAIEKYGQSSVT